MEYKCDSIPVDGQIKETKYCVYGSYIRDTLEVVIKIETSYITNIYRMSLLLTPKSSKQNKKF